jgi:transposase
VIPEQIAHFGGRERRLVNPKYSMLYPWKQGGNMARKRLTMKKIKEVLRLKYEAGLSNRVIAGACKISNSTVGDYLKRAEAAGIGWSLEEIGEGELI